MATSALQKEIKDTDINEFYLEDADGNGDYYTKGDVDKAIDEWVNADTDEEDTLLVYQLVRVVKVKSQVKKVVSIVK